jgi:predicted GNAT superfamily acetyltransferase
MTAAGDSIHIRPFETIEEFRECVALQEDTWGGGFSERVSPAILKVSQILGGVSSGAYAADGRLVGFVFGMTGVRDGELAHWSDMLAVRPELRDAGLGRRLKAYQREAVLDMGIDKMFWTFDPLRARNAHLNLTKLGAVVREYEVDMYGDTDSPLHRGIGTDRFIALWLLSSDRVQNRLGSPEATPPAVPTEGEVPLALAATESHGLPAPAEPRLDLHDDWVAVTIPSDLSPILEADMELARTWRARTRAALLSYLARGYEVREFVRGPTTSKYLLTGTPLHHSEAP